MAAVTILNSEGEYHKVDISFGSHVYQPLLTSKLTGDALQQFVQAYADNYEVEYNSMMEATASQEG